MNSRQRDLVHALVGSRRKPISRVKFLCLWGATDGRALALDQLLDAIARRDADDLEYALIIGFRFGPDDRFREPLKLVALQYWHTRHEDVVAMLVDVLDESCFEVLEFLSAWVPYSLLWDDSRALSVRALHGLARLSDPRVDRLLFEWRRSDISILSATATELARRRSELGESPST